jgi:hypothetical protein
MGMDVYGKKPSSEAGKYFRNNIWWWDPLARYILEHVPPEITGRCKHWYSNDGDGLDAADALKLAQCLREQIANGACEEYADGVGHDSFAVDNVEGSVPSLKLAGALKSGNSE